jgi:hypothetical protein
MRIVSFGLASERYFGPRKLIEATSGKQRDRPGSAPSHGVRELARRGDIPKKTDRAIVSATFNHIN